jgi:anti-sigma-K factor RskA
MNEQKHTMTGAWALNALDAEERARMERYLAENPEAAAEARSFEETAAELASDAPPLAPRPDLKASVMARIGTTRQLSPLPQHEEGDGPETAPAAEHSPETSSTAPTEPTEPTAQESPEEMTGEIPEEAPPTRSRAGARRSDSGARRGHPHARRRGGGARSSGWFALAATLLMVTTLGGIGLWSAERSAHQDAREALEALESQQATAAEERAMITDIMAAEDSSQLSLPVHGGGSLQVMYSREQQAMIVQGTGLPELTGEEGYQLWMVQESDGTTSFTSAGMLGVSGEAVMSTGEIGEGTSIGLTVEPAGGSPQPTTDPIAAGAL